MKKKIAVFCAALLILGCELACAAADKVNSKDDPLIPRYAGSNIIGYQKKNYDELVIALAPITDYDRDKKEYVIDKSASFKGEVTRIAYLIPPGASALEVFENYKSSLAGAGFVPLFESGGDKLGNQQNAWFGDPLEEQICQLLQYSPKASRYLAAELDKDGRKTDVALYVTEYQLGTRCNNDVKDGQTLAEIFIVKSGAMASKMVSVSAGDIQKGIDALGHVAIYGVYFDTNKSDLKPESKPSLDQVAKYLQDNPMVNIHVVGHTDNVGTLDANLKLSRARAASVVAALVKDYGVAQGRLNPAGVAQLAPIASNATEEGRAKNRRVELIPQ